MILGDIVYADGPDGLKYRAKVIGYKRIGNRERFTAEYIEGPLDGTPGEFIDKEEE